MRKSEKENIELLETRYLKSPRHRRTVARDVSQLKKFAEIDDINAEVAPLSLTASMEGGLEYIASLVAKNSYLVRSSLLEAVAKGDEEHVAFLINAGANYSDIIYHYRANYPNQYIDMAHILLKVKLNPEINKTRYLFDILLMATYTDEGQLEGLLDFAISHGYDLNAKTKEKNYSILSHSLIFADKNLVSILIKRRIGLDIPSIFLLLHKDKDPEYFASIFKAAGFIPSAQDLVKMICIGDFYVLKVLKDVGFEIKLELDEILTAALVDEGKDFLFDIGYFSSKDEAEKFSIFSKAKMALDAFYSGNEYVQVFLKKRFLHKDILETEEIAEREVFADIFKSIDEGKAIKYGDSSYKIVDVPYEDHAVYSITDYDAEDIAQSISFCNGGFPYWDFGNGRSGHGEVVFKIDNEKVKKIDSIERFIKKAFIRKYTIEEKDLFLQDLAKIAICDEAGRPIVIWFDVATPLQKRDNCGVKSLNILYRAILRRIHPELNFKLDASGKVSGRGSEIYKQYKKAFVAKNVNRLLFLVDPENRDEKSRGLAMKKLQETFNRALEKADLDVISMILPVFIREGRDLRHSGLENLKLKEENQIRDKELLKNIFWKTIDANPRPLSDLQKGNIDFIWDLCCKAGTNISPYENDDSDAILRWAVLEKKNPELVNLMARNGADVNCEDENGSPLIAQAMRIKDIPLGVIQELLSFEADVNARYKYKEGAKGKHIFHMAMDNDRADICEFLKDSRGFEMPNLGAAGNKRFYGLPEERGIFDMLKSIESPSSRIKSPMVSQRPRWKG